MERKIIDNMVNIVKAYYKNEDLKNKITSEEILEIIDGYFSDDNIDSSIAKEKYKEVLENNREEILDLVNENVVEENEFSLNEEDEQENENFSDDDIVELFKAEHLESSYYDEMIENDKLSYQNIYDSWKEFFDSEYQVKTDNPEREIKVITDFLKDFYNYMYENDLNNQRFV